MLTHLPFELAVLGTVAKFVHVVVVGGLLVIAYRWSRRGRQEDDHREAGEVRRR